MSPGAPSQCRPYVQAKSHHYELLTNLQTVGKMYLLEQTSSSQLKKRSLERMLISKTTALRSACWLKRIVYLDQGT